MEKSGGNPFLQRENKVVHTAQGRLLAPLQSHFQTFRFMSCYPGCPVLKSFLYITMYISRNKILLNMDIDALLKR